MSTKIKQNLFRFVTLRNPQLIEEKDKQLGFVYHPDEKTGVYFSAISGLKQKDIPLELINVSETFKASTSAFEKKGDVRDFNEKLYNFSSWLMRNKNALSYAEIKANINGAVVLSKEDEILIWDNLIYQTIVRSSVYVREALIQVLIANKFLAHFVKFAEGLSEDIIFTEEQEKEFKRAAFSSVVIAKQLLLETNNGSINTQSNDNINQKRLGGLVTAKYDIAISTKLESEIKTAKKSYEDSERQAYKTALESHQKAVDAIIANGSNQLVDQWNVEKQVYDKVEQFVHEPLPSFEYQKSTEIDTKKLQESLSPLTYDFLKTNKLDALDTFDAVLKQIKSLRKSRLNEVERLLPKQGKSILKNGVKMRVEDPFKNDLEGLGDLDSHIKTLVESDTKYGESFVIEDFSVASKATGLPTTDYCLLVRPNQNRLGKRNVYMYLATPTGTEIIGASYTLSLNANSSVSYNDSHINVVHGGPSSTHIGMLLFNNGLTLLDAEYTLTGQFELNNGKTISFTVPNLLMQKGAEGSTTCSEVTDTATTSGQRNIYGVTNLGIADFRRVEQEVCCYVPGEVSHVENVMAREYKERSTRSLTSSEFTAEQTDERERENLTDTTSTERNEMQSEVASVLNEDQAQSYGGNANFGGKIKGTDLHFNTGAFFDSSSSSSTSNSNSQAQTYAQEVTERAMERIVQKTQTKRTSRILKEFEENTSHGFDNRKGSEHVTGVYRWVDKIYKNTLINYGKRLMYEFAIPEPSKFFQEAVWKAIDTTGQVESGVILPEIPVHPKDYGLTDASVLGYGDYGSMIDYQEIAAKYNAEVSSKPADSIYIGKSFSSFTANSDGGEYRETMNGDEDFELPKGYETLKAKAIFKVPSEGNRKGCVLVGDKKFLYSTYANSNGDSIDYEDIDTYTEKIPVSFSSVGFHAGNISISIECKLSENGLQQWQNETYNAIMDAYYDRLQEYNDAMREIEANNSLTPDAEKLTFNPLQNKSIMLRELKRVAIELLIDQTKVSRDNYSPKNEATDVSPVKKVEAFQTHASTVKFFEQAFDWDIMAYVFYPYFYADESDWKKLFQSQDTADPLFQAFLQSGMARTVVPVRPGFEDAVNWYMSTGEIWNGQGLVADQDDDLYVSVAEEMQTIEGVVEGTWETRLPTALTMLQAGSIGLKVEGLPCNTECNDNLLFDSDGNPVLDENGEQVSIIEQTNTLIGGEEQIDTTPAA